MKVNGNKYIMKVVCINNVELGRDSYGKPRHNILPLTIGKAYEVVDEASDYLLLDDNNDYDDKLNFPLVYSKTHFVTQDVWREMQLNKLL
jgi:hypothetical protein